MIGPILLAVAALCYATLTLRKSLRRKSLRPGSSTSSAEILKPPPGSILKPTRKSNRDAETELGVYKILYHRLHNIEHYPSVLVQSKEILINFLSDGIDIAVRNAGHTILSIEVFNPEALRSFIQRKDESIGLAWEAYISRRISGGHRELFSDREAAKHWLKQRSPVKYVDGAWLGHIHKISTPFQLRSITKNAWQILSEELGDGDLAKNHAQVYRLLMEEIGANLPDGDSEEFIQPHHGLDSLSIWKAALAQLVISLFPHDFLPEILGFNLHFELLTWDTMRAIKELRELDISDYYFRLHISIDNADTGHTAMALRIVLDYMEFVRKQEGETIAAQAWKRIQAGYLLSEMFDGPSKSTLSAIEANIIRVFEGKALVSQKLHCASRIKMSGKPLTDWLDPQHFSSTERQRNFLDTLSKATPWICAGDSQSSRLVKQMLWKGQMFGAFTSSEISLLETWINSLSLQSPSQTYREFAGFDIKPDQKSLSLHRVQDVFSIYPFFDRNLSSLRPGTSDARQDRLELEINIRKSVDMKLFIPLWFSHQGLLESFVSIPMRTCKQSTSAIIRVLRAQYGFHIEDENIAGMDEFDRGEVVDLVDIGLHMMERGGLPKARSLAHVMELTDPSRAKTMLELAMRPLENSHLLLGMATAFADLHSTVGSDIDSRLIEPSKAITLRAISQREKAGLEACRKEMVQNEADMEKVSDGFMWAKSAIQECFH